MEQAHARGLEFHAWFNVFESRFRFSGSPAQLNPDWVCRDQGGVSMPSEISWLSPGLPQVREYLVRIAMEIVRNYDIDGLHLDFVRWNEHTNSGLSLSLAKQNFQEHLPDGMITDAQIRDLSSNASGRFLYDIEHPFSEGIPGGFGSWEDWWRWSVTEFVRTLHDSIQAVKPWVRLSPAALGRYNWGGWQGFNVVYQDAALWFNEGYIEQLIGMHYHWLLPQDFLSVLTTGCPNCWSQFIQPGINAGRLYTVGLFSDRFSERNIFGRQPSIINAVRGVPWSDGFQFFSYGSWRDRNYWEEARVKIFSGKSKIRPTHLVDDVPPDAPLLSLSKTDSLTYGVTVTPTDNVDASYWFAIYRSEDSQLSRQNDEIVSIHFGNSTYSFTDSFSGDQDFDGTYHYFATSLDRFWNESGVSNSTESDSIPSFAPRVVKTTPAAGDTIPVNSDIILTFSKTMDSNSAGDAISFSPSVTVAELIWSQDEKMLTVGFAENLQFDTNYTMTVAPSVRDINGRALDGNGDGVEGDPFILEFRSLTEDVFGPQIIASYPDINSPDDAFVIDDVVTFVFDELLDKNSVSDQSIQFKQGSDDVLFGFQVARVSDRSVLSIQALTPLEPDQEYSITLAPEISDTLGNQLGMQVLQTFRTSTARYAEIADIDRFLSTFNWFQPNESGSTTGIIVPNTSFRVSTEAYLPASSPRQRIAPALTYEWDESASDFLIRVFLSGGPARAVEFDSSYVLQCYVFGDGSNNKFRFAVDDNLPVAAAQNHEVSNWVTVDWIGWRLLEWELGDPNSFGIWLGNGVPNGQLRFDSFQLTHEPGDASTGKIFFDNLRLVKKTTLPVSVAEVERSIPETFQLFQNYPNPFNPSTTISFDLPEPGMVTLKVFDVLGREVATLVQERKAAGRYKVHFNAKGRASGTYIYRLSINGKAYSKRMLYIR